MAFHIFTTERVSCFGQYDRIDDFTTGKLGGDKCPVFRQFLIGEFHSPAVFKFLDPFFVSHGQSSSGEEDVWQVYVLPLIGNLRVGNEDSTSDNPTYFQSPVIRKTSAGVVGNLGLAEQSP